MLYRGNMDYFSDNEQLWCSISFWHSYQHFLAYTFSNIPFFLFLCVKIVIQCTILFTIELWITVVVVVVVVYCNRVTALYLQRLHICSSCFPSAENWKLYKHAWFDR